MKNLKNYLVAGVIVLGSLESYSQKIEDEFKQYNEKNLLIRECKKENEHTSIFCTNSCKTCKTCIDYKYDEKGRKIEEIYETYIEDDKKFNWLDQYNYKYDEQGNIIEEVHMGDNENDGKFNYKHKYNFKYDEKGRKIEEIRKIDMDNDEKLEGIAQYNFKYDEKGREIIQLSYDLNGDGLFDWIGNP